MMTTADFASLIPDLKAWNDGKGIEPQSWIECVGNYELAAGYSLIFWPDFVRFGGYVLRDGFCEESLRGFEVAMDNNRSDIEAIMNHIHIADIHCNVEASEAQIRHFGRVLKDIHDVKLSRDFPDLRFEVSFNDEAGLDPIDYELTFWQTTV